MSAALTFTDVCLTLGDGEDTVSALDHVSLSVAPGELVGVIGPSGSGKSSLLAVAGALTTPTSGSVSLGETDLLAASARQRTAIRRDRVGFVFQSTNLIPSLTAVEQIRLPATFVRGRSVRDPLELLAEVGMAHKADRRPHQLSGGERQRVGIARALATRPEMLLVDEPTAALDRQRSQEVVGLLAAEAHDHGVGAIMVTHDHEVLHHCDSVYEMVDGRLTLLGA